MKNDNCKSAEFRRELLALLDKYQATIFTVNVPRWWSLDTEDLVVTDEDNNELMRIHTGCANSHSIRTEYPEDGTKREPIDESYYVIFSNGVPEYGRYDDADEMAKRLGDLLHDYEPTETQVALIRSELFRLPLGIVTCFGEHRVVRLKTMKEEFKELIEHYDHPTKTI